MKPLKSNDSGSVDPSLIFIICLAVTSFLVLVFGEVLTVFFSIMMPGPVKTFLLAFWPNGMLISILIILIFTLLMAYQKKYYQQGGG